MIRLMYVYKVMSTFYSHIYFRVIQNIADARPKVRYLVAVDDSQNTLEEIVKVCKISVFPLHALILQI